jgi:hypothetical protein
LHPEPCTSGRQALYHWASSPDFYVFLKKGNEVGKCKCTGDAKLFQEGDKFSYILLSK